MYYLYLFRTAGFHTACLWNTTNKERFGRYMQTCGLQGVFDGFENNKERYETDSGGAGLPASQYLALGSGFVVKYSVGV